MTERELRILIVEDLPSDAELLDRELRKAGFSFVSRCVETEEAYRRELREFSPDLVLSDYLLPSFDGMRALKILQEAALAIPFIVVTGSINEETAAACIKAGASDYVIKEHLGRIGTAIQSSFDKKQMEEEKARAEEALKLTQFSVDHGAMPVFWIGQNGWFYYVNDATCEALGYSREELLGMTVHDIDPEFPPEAWPAHWRELQDRKMFTFESRHRRKDGLIFPVEVTANYFEYKGREYNFAFARDVSERRRAEEALLVSEERYALACRASNDGLWDWNLATNEIYYSPRWKETLGFKNDEIGNSSEEWFKRVHPEDLERLRSDISLHLDGLISHLENEHRVLHKDGTYRWILSRAIAVRDADGKAVRMAGSQSDITERKRAEEQLLHSAFYDALTGLPNRALFMDRLERSTARAKRDPDFKFAVLSLDLDRFKLLNDSLGHVVGDQLLVAVAQRFSGCLAPGDTIAHLGGDDFVILMDDIRGVGETVRLANQIQKKLENVFSLSGHEVFAAVSIGIALNNPEATSPEELLRDAETAMYRAKAMGKARCEIFDAEMHAHAVSLQTIESDLRRAIERQEFLVHYQPILSIRSGKITGFEALVRWMHPQKGLVPPLDFIPVAEETGLIVPIGEWVLRTACAQSKDWRVPGGIGPLSIAVNFSAVQFESKGLVPSIKKILRETGRDSSSLGIEITESVAMSNLPATMKILKELHELGVQILIDDFGTGYSSLVSLKRFPISALKIDRSFVAGLPNDPEDIAIANTIIAMAQSLRLRVIAEGVETPEQFAFLRSLQCDELQGYLFGRPVPAEEIPALLERKHPLLEENVQPEPPGRAP